MNDKPANRWYLGIDPGAHGAIVAFYPNGRKILGTTLHGMLTHEITYWLEVYKDRDTVAYFEEVGGYVGKEETAKGSRMFTFGWHAGMVWGMLSAMHIKCEIVIPQDWQKSLGIPLRVTRGKGKETKEQWKRRLKEEAQRRFPERKITGDMADALLIAEYGYLLREGHLAQ